MDRIRNIELTSNPLYLSLQQKQCTYPRSKGKTVDLELEYEDHRRKALEREQRISRQLHDEINKNRKTK